MRKEQNESIKVPKGLFVICSNEKGMLVVSLVRVVAELTHVWYDRHVTNE
jgi:hypothetical protein